MTNSTNGSEIAIIGMAGRFPGEKTIDKFWQNLQNGVESISFFTDEELLASGTNPVILNDPKFVKARAVLEDVECFDAAFFGFNPREAEITDPQQRLFLECAWEALERAGYDSEKYQGAIGVFGGTSLNSYMLEAYTQGNLIDSVDVQQLAIASDKDFLTTRVSYKLNLEGPSYTIQTACSTSLVAVHLACQSLLNGECDIALAGGVSISSSRKAGYLYKEGGISSPDGHCRAFDANARGTVSGEGVGIVVLKRLEDALAEGDFINAVIKGSATNNDGSFKVSYTAPRIDSQARAIRMAQVMAEVEPETIAYIEAHGTGTPMGDPIEIAALTQAFRADTEKNGFCAIGSLKTNIGHLDAAAGVAGLIKTVLALQHKQIPPSLHFCSPNRQIDFANSPFYVNTQLSEWQTNGIPRRAGVSSFGIGGTNAHVILEEAPAVEVSSTSRPWQLLMLSAKTETALETATTNLVNYLKERVKSQNSNPPSKIQNPKSKIDRLADVAYTLQVGRRDFDYRRMLVCQTLDDAVQALSTLDSQRVFTHYQEPSNCPVVFMFSGQGSQYVNMALELYQHEPIFTEHVDNCCEQLKPHLGLDLRHVLYPNATQEQEATQQLQQTHITQPALFVIEYALAKLWMAWGVHPEVMIGHSIGEYVAACLAGVFSLEDALWLVAARGRLMQQLPSGAMLSIQLPEQEVQTLLGEDLALAASNSPASSVVSGSAEEIAQLQQTLQEKSIPYRKLHTSHAFHSPMMEPMIEPFTKLLRQVTFNPPQIPFVSNLTGTWITPAEATNPNYWARHLRQPVRFSAGLTELLKRPERVLLEVGPGRTLSTFAKQHQSDNGVLNSLRHPQEQQSDVAFLLNSLGRLWLAGVKVDWLSFYANERRHRLPLPTYPFDRQRYWIDLPKLEQAAPKKPVSSERKPDLADWFYIPVWKQSLPPVPREIPQREKLKSRWLVFVDECGVGSQIATRLQNEGHDVICVRGGEQFGRTSDREYIINPRSKNDYYTLIGELLTQNQLPDTIIHLWSVTLTPELRPASLTSFEQIQHLGFYSLLFLSQALDKQLVTEPLKIWVVSNGMHGVESADALYPEKTTLLGLCKVIPQEYSNITCQTLDFVHKLGFPSEQNLLPSASHLLPSFEKAIDQLLAELTGLSPDLAIAYRGHQRWIQTFEPVRFDNRTQRPKRLREGGVYLITGGLGKIGLILAQHLARTMQAKLILIGRSGLPAKSEWEQWLATHDDRISTRIRQVQELEELGAEVLVWSADVADEAQMRLAIAQAEERFGKIHGVIHAAATLGDKFHRTIQETGYSECDWQFQPKVYGLYTLEKVLQGKELDFCLLMSSIASVLGGVAVAAYSAANAFVDAFAHKQHQLNLSHWCSANWFQADKEQSAEVFQRETVEVFQRILSNPPVPQVTMWRSDLTAAIDKWIKRESWTTQKDAQPIKPTPALYSSLNRRNPYVAPSNEIERKIASIYQHLLGIEQVGIHDNFFELGGNSLIGTQLISQLRKEFQVELSVRHVFERPTVAEQALVIQQSQEQAENKNIHAIPRSDRGNAQEILANIDQLSDEEVNSLLSGILSE